MRNSSIYALMFGRFWHYTVTSTKVGGENDEISNSAILVYQ